MTNDEPAGPEKPEDSAAPFERLALLEFDLTERVRTIDLSPVLPADPVLRSARIESLRRHMGTRPGFAPLRMDAQGDTLRWWWFKPAPNFNIIDADTRFLSLICSFVSKADDQATFAGQTGTHTTLVQWQVHAGRPLICIQSNQDGLLQRLTDWLEHDAFLPTPTVHDDVMTFPPVAELAAEAAVALILEVIRRWVVEFGGTHHHLFVNGAQTTSESTD